MYPCGMVETIPHDTFGMPMISQYDAQCALCRGFIPEGEEISYLAPSGDLPAVVKHKLCPTKPQVLHTRDAEESLDWLACPHCGTTWTIRRGGVIEHWRCCNKLAIEREEVPA